LLGQPHLEIVTGRSRSQTDATWRQTDSLSKVAGGATGLGLGAILTRQLTQLPLVDVGNQVGREETLGHVPLETDGPGALSVDAQL
jgi:hypothetical protein